MKENYLFREDPRPEVYEVPQPEVYEVPQPAANLPVPAGQCRNKPTHAPSLTLGILALAFSAFLPMVSMILGIIGRVSGENHALTYNIVGGKICCNVAFVLTGLQWLLIFAQMLSQRIVY